jgi:hypothetical protein
MSAPSTADRLWSMTGEERTAAFYRGELSLGDCLAWARRMPDEPPRSPDGEYLFITVRTPEWSEDRSPSRPSRTRSAGRDL